MQANNATLKEMDMVGESSIVSLPQPGEKWKFNGKVLGVPVFSDCAGSCRIDGMSCWGGNAEKYLRTVRIFEVAAGSSYARVSGTHNMKWLSGWINVRSEKGELIVDRLASENGVT